MKRLSDKKCAPCERGQSKLGASEIAGYMVQLPKWTLVRNREILCRFTFKNFAGSLVFVNRVGALAEAEGHHPDIRFGWGYAEITIYTHAINGLSENDFILAAKIDCLRQSDNQNQS